mmetsp:Transcript_2117/g.6929  ORF Transcript_2117/g.6929 Transcript_2117/m.6929 type:complete len:347 (+) Transcript_2117:750-1790(+)
MPPSARPRPPAPTSSSRPPPPRRRTASTSKRRSQASAHGGRPARLRWPSSASRPPSSPSARCSSSTARSRCWMECRWLWARWAWASGATFRLASAPLAQPAPCCCARACRARHPTRPSGPSPPSAGARVRARRYLAAATSHTPGRVPRRAWPNGLRDTRALRGSCPPRLTFMRSLPPPEDSPSQCRPQWATRTCTSTRAPPRPAPPPSTGAPSRAAPTRCGSTRLTLGGAASAATSSACWRRSCRRDSPSWHRRTAPPPCSTTAGRSSGPFPQGRTRRFWSTFRARSCRTGTWGCRCWQPQSRAPSRSTRRRPHRPPTPPSPGGPTTASAARASTSRGTTWHCPRV